MGQLVYNVKQDLSLGVRIVGNLCLLRTYSKPRMDLGYILRRVAIFALVIVAASTLNFFLPRFSGEDPVLRKLLDEATRGGYVPPNLDLYVEEYRERLGLNDPLIIQYFNYLNTLVGFDLGVSITNFPTTVNSLIGDRILWTVFMGGITTLFGFTMGTLMGALLAWPRSPGYLKYILFTPILTLSAVPYYLLGLLALYLFTFQIPIFPPFGGYSTGGVWLSQEWGNPVFWLDVLRHAALPGLSIILANMGFWALAMRGLMVTNQGEDFMVFAEAKGLNPRRIFLWYAVRNSLLPQITALALALGHIITNVILVELVFSYPGLGGLLVQAITQSDFPTLQGVIFVVILGLSSIILVLDLIYPLIDSRIKYSNS